MYIHTHVCVYIYIYIYLHGSSFSVYIYTYRYTDCSFTMDANVRSNAQAETPAMFGASPQIAAAMGYHRNEQRPSSQLNPKPRTLNTEPKTQKPKPQTLNPNTETLSPKPETLDPKPCSLILRSPLISRPRQAVAVSVPKPCRLSRPGGLSKL